MKPSEQEIEAQLQHLKTMLHEHDEQGRLLAPVSKEEIGRDYLTLRACLEAIQAARELRATIRALEWQGALTSEGDEEGLDADVDRVSGAIQALVNECLSWKHDAKRLTAAMRKGKVRGGTPPFGFTVGEDGTFVEDVEQQRAIAAIHKLNQDGMSTRRIAKFITDQGIKVSHTTVAQVLKGR